jgi:hypothetical protein
MNPRTLVRDLANAILAKEHFARNSSGVLCAYRGGVYRTEGEMLIANVSSIGSWTTAARAPKKSFSASADGAEVSLRLDLFSLSDHRFAETVARGIDAPRQPVSKTRAKRGTNTYGPP